MRIANPALLAVLVLSSASVAAAEPAPGAGPPAIYAQHLVDVALKAHPEVIVLAVHATPPKTSDNVIIASNIGRIGKKADADDLHVITTGETKTEVNPAGDHFSVEEPLLDVSGLTIGALGVSFPYTKGQDTTRDQAIARDVQTFFRKHVLSDANLVDAYPYSSYATDNAAQTLVDATMARHPELLVLGMHVTLPGGRGNVMLASNIGRIGKKADEDDMRVVNTGRSNFEVAENGKRYEVELVLENAQKANIGALGVVFPYKDGDDKTALNARAVAIRDEMARAISSAASLLAKTAASAGPPLTLTGSAKLPGYKGDFDHFAVDAQVGKLFLAGEDGAALEVFDLRSGAFVRSMKGYGVPHSILVMPQTNELLVIDGGKPSPILDARTLARKRTLKLPAGADSVAYDGATGHLWVVTGGKDVPQPDSWLLEIDPHTGMVFNHVHFNANHVEALAVEEHGNALYINVTDKNKMAVIDKHTGTITKWWTIKEAQQNAPLAMDESTHRLFVVTRKPGKLIVLNADTGTTVAAFAAPGHADQVIWDAANRRVYVPGGDGTIGVYQQDDANHYTALARVASAPGAKTAVLAPALHRLYVAASPGDTRVGGAVLRFDVSPRR
ncbi:MAG: hypothetical protein JOZ86_09750 [Candidatus Eremiobacteraeota bacterium]|nr:hypothetical protein [Candidatus Eremiobacteraeota bacterium]